jgi:hypothetical protein
MFTTKKYPGRSFESLKELNTFSLDCENERKRVEKTSDVFREMKVAKILSIRKMRNVQAPKASAKESPE